MGAVSGYTSDTFLVKESLPPEACKNSPVPDYELGSGDVKRRSRWTWPQEETTSKEDVNYPGSSR